MKQTAVEWLHNQLHLNISLYQDEWQIIEGLMEQAKEIEKQQMIDAYESLEHRHGQNYYNATFKNEPR